MNIFKKITAFSAAALMSIASLTGCGSGNDFVGKWEAKSITSGGQTLEGDLGGTPVAVAFQVEFKDGGEGEILVAGSDSKKFNWEADGETITAKSSEESSGISELKFQKDGDELKAEQSGMNVVLVKVDEFTERPAE